VPMGDARSTLDDVRGAERSHRAMLARRAVLVGLGAVVAAGATGLLGLRTSTRSVDSGGWRVSLRYPRLARAGLDVTWQVRVRSPQPFGAGTSVELAVTGTYFEQFETQGFYPEPESESRDGRWRYLEFAPREGSSELVVDFDTYVQPAAQVGRDAELRVLVDDEQVAALSWTTTLLP
jgi:hypothetical protein